MFTNIVLFLLEVLGRGLDLRFWTQTKTRYSFLRSRPNLNPMGLKNRDPDPSKRDGFEAALMPLHDFGQIGDQPIKKAQKHMLLSKRA